MLQSSHQMLEIPLRVGTCLVPSHRRDERRLLPMRKFAKAPCLETTAGNLMPLHRQGRKIVKYYSFCWSVVCSGLFIVSPLNALAMGAAESNSVWLHSGWACDPSTPGYQAEVQAWRDDGLFLGRMIADRTPKTAISASCASSHGLHGFSLHIERKPAWTDGKVHEVTLYSVDRNGKSAPFHKFSAPFVSMLENVQLPRNMGDIVGRDLDSKIEIAAKFGHIGIWDGSMVVEVLSDAGVNKVFRNNWDDFKSRTKPWDTAYPRYPDMKITTCWDKRCDIHPNRPGQEKVSAPHAVVKRATQVYMIGADYSILLKFTAAEPELYDFTNPEWKREAVRGVYRSDVFVYDAFLATADLHPGDFIPHREIEGMTKSWHDKVVSLYGFALTLPYKVMEKIRNF